jgi:hypothetical protein
MWGNTNPIIIHIMVSIKRKAEIERRRSNGFKLSKYIDKTITYSPRSLNEPQVG